MTPLLAAVVDGEWRPGIGDPHFMGWFTVFAYFAAACLCWRVARHRHRSVSSNIAWFWYLLVVLMVALGINKQLDLQTWFTLTGRRLAIEQGWYEQRRGVQAMFVAAVGLGGLGVLALLMVVLRRHLRECGLALFGLLFTVCFVVIRAASFYRVDRMIGWEFAGMRMNWILELTGIACVAAGAFTAHARPRPDPPTAGRSRPPLL